MQLTREEGGGEGILGEQIILYVMSDSCPGNEQYTMSKPRRVLHGCNEERSGIIHHWEAGPSSKCIWCRVQDNNPPHPSLRKRDVLKPRVSAIISSTVHESSNTKYMAEPKLPRQKLPDTIKASSISIPSSVAPAAYAALGFAEPFCSIGPTGVVYQRRSTNLRTSSITLFL